MLDHRTNASLREMKSKALTGSYKAGEEATMHVFQNSIQFLGMGIAIVINLMAPDHITLGGGLVEEMPRFYLQALREQIAIYAIPELLLRREVLRREARWRRGGHRRRGVAAKREALIMAKTEATLSYRGPAATPDRRGDPLRREFSDPAGR